MVIINTPTIGNTITNIKPVESEFGVLCEELEVLCEELGVLCEELGVLCEELGYCTLI
jgi:hypothetical protein